MSQSDVLDFLVRIRDFVSVIVKLHYTSLESFPTFTKLFYLFIASFMIYKTLKYVVVKSLVMLKFLLKLIIYSLLMVILASMVLNLKSPVQIQEN